MTCSERVIVSKVYDEKRKEYVVEKEVTGVSLSECLRIEPDQLKDCISSFVVKYNDVNVMDRTLKVWNWGVIDELDSNGVLPSRITANLLPW